MEKIIFILVALTAVLKKFQLFTKGRTYIKSDVMVLFKGREETDSKNPKVINTIMEE